MFNLRMRNVIDVIEGQSQSLQTRHETERLHGRHRRQLIVVQIQLRHAGQIVEVALTERGDRVVGEIEEAQRVAHGEKRLIPQRLQVRVAQMQLLEVPRHRQTVGRAWAQVDHIRPRALESGDNDDFGVVVQLDEEFQGNFINLSPFPILLLSIGHFPLFDSEIYPVHLKSIRFIVCNAIRISFWSCFVECFTLKLSVFPPPLPHFSWLPFFDIFSFHFRPFNSTWHYAIHHLPWRCRLEWPCRHWCKRRVCGRNRPSRRRIWWDMMPKRKLVCKVMRARKLRWKPAFYLRKSEKACILLEENRHSQSFLRSEQPVPSVSPLCATEVITVLSRGVRSL